MPTLRLGSLELSSPFLLAPLESVSDCAFRRLCWQQGAALTWTEMIRAGALARGNRSAIELIDPHDADVPTGVQLMTTGERELALALERLEGLAAAAPRLRNLRAVDLNFGCPSPEIIRSGGGPALLKRRTKLRAILEALAAWRGRTTLPIGAVGLKIRLGLNRAEQDQQVYLRVAEVASETVDYLTVHARHARQESTEPATWSAIAEVKARASIPVIGNGDVTGRADAERMFRETGCDGILVARAAIRSPWVFRELLGAGPGLPTPAELDAAERDYFEQARRLGTRPKFLEWHHEGFRRLRARLAGQQEPGPALPANAHMR